MNVTVYSHFEGKTWVGEVPDELLEGDTNEQLFRLFNRVDERDGARLQKWGYRLPSLSVNDRVEWGGLIWQVGPAGWDLVSSTELEMLQRQYGELSRLRAKWMRIYDRSADGSVEHDTARQMLGRIGDDVREVEDQQSRAAGWFDRKQDGQWVASLLAPLTVGTEFRLDQAPTAYVATYRKNQDGTWSQVEGTCEPPHVTNMAAEHLGFCVGAASVREALQQVVKDARVDADAFLRTVPDALRPNGLKGQEPRFPGDVEG